MFVLLQKVAPVQDVHVVLSVNIPQQHLVEE